MDHLRWLLKAVDHLSWLLKAVDHLRWLLKAVDHLSYIVAPALLDVDGTRLGAVVTLCGCLWRNLAAIGSKKKGL